MRVSMTRHGRVVRRAVVLAAEDSLRVRRGRNESVRSRRVHAVRMRRAEELRRRRVEEVRVEVGEQQVPVLLLVVAEGRTPKVTGASRNFFLTKLIEFLTVNRLPTPAALLAALLLLLPPAAG